MNTDVVKLPDGSGFFTTEVLSREEALALPPDKRPLNYRISSALYHKTWEAIGAASMCWDPRPGDQVFKTEEASKIAIDLCLLFAEELEKGQKPEPRPTMDELAHREKVPALWSDKRSKTPGTDYVGHDYLRFYDREWSKWRDEPIRLLEIGLNVGASIKLWLQYFSKAQVMGMDIVDFKFAPEIEQFIVERGLLNRFTFVKGNQFSPYDLQRFVEDQPMFDIIIDDGAHSSGPIIMSFQYLWSKVKPGGYYVIEDLGEFSNPASHTTGYPNQVEFCRDLLEQVILGRNDVDEAFVSKELVMLRKKV